MALRLDFTSVHDILLAVHQRKAEAEAEYGVGPPRKHDDFAWLVILAREFGEVSEEVGISIPTNVTLLREELLDVAQVCVAWIQDMTYGWGEPELPLSTPEVVTVFQQPQGDPIELEDGTIVRIVGIRESPAMDSLGNVEPEELMPATRKLMEELPSLFNQYSTPEVGLALQAALDKLRPTQAVVTDEDGTVRYLDPSAVEFRYD